MRDNYSNDSKKVINNARHVSDRFRHEYISTVHIILGMLIYRICDAVEMLQMLDVDIESLHNNLETSLKPAFDSTDENIESGGPVPFTPGTKRMVEHAIKEKRRMGMDYVEPSHLLLGILKDNDSEAAHILKAYKVTYKKIADLFNEPRFRTATAEESSSLEGGAHPSRSRGGLPKKSLTPTLDHFGCDLTVKAKEGHLDQIIGRNKEIERMIHVLSRRTKNNPIILGESGTGKTAIVDGLVQRIVAGNVPDKLLKKRIVALELGSMVAGTRFRGEFEKRLQSVIEEIKKDKNIILFIDEIHTIVGAGSAEGSLDASNILKPSLGRGEIQCIGATTTDEYRKHFEHDNAMNRRFQPIRVTETTFEDTVEILKGIRKYYESYHSVSYPDQTIHKIVELAKRYILDKRFPDKAIDVMDEVGAKVSLSTEKSGNVVKLEKEKDKLLEQRDESIAEQNFEEAAKLRDLINEREKRLIAMRKSQATSITNDDVRSVMGSMTGIPAENINSDSDDAKRFLMMEETLNKTVIHQEEAIGKISSIIKRSKSGIRNPDKPNVLLFVGASGVGKCHAKGTELIMYDGSIKKVENIKKGDFLMGDDSNRRTVLSTCTGKDSMYRITPTKGNSFVVNKPHILSLKNTNTKKVLNISVADYLKKSNYFKQSHKLYKVGVEFTEKNLIVDPYFVGLWIGDGTAKTAAITTADDVLVNYIYDFSKNYDTVKVRISEHKNNKSNTYFITGDKGKNNNKLLFDMRKIGLFASKEKAIPTDYLINSVANRKKLLAGLIDSDGWKSNEGNVSIATIYKHLAEQISFLAGSLGFASYIKEKKCRMCRNEEKLFYDVRIIGDLSDLPILLSRKQSHVRKQIKDPLINGFTIKSIGERNYYGFEIDGNRLYLMKDFTVTHNTFVAKKLAEFIFGDEDSLTYIDCSELSTSIDVNKLLGTAGGYVGYDDAGKFEKIRQNPYCVILLDECEKAHKDIWNIFLRIFEEGEVEDSKGRLINFRNTVIIMTSNIGGHYFTTKKKIGFDEDDITKGFKDISKKILNEVKKHFRPELLNRLDDTIVFNSLGIDDLKLIVLNEIKNLQNRLADMKIELEVKDKALKYLVDNADKESKGALGARPLKRAIDTMIESKISDLLLEQGGNLKKITVNVIKDKLEFITRKKK